MNVIIRLLRSVNFWTIVGVVASFVSVYLVWFSQRPQSLEFVTTYGEESVEREDSLLVEYLLVNYVKTDTLIAVSQPFSLLNEENKSAKDFMYSINIDVIKNDSAHYRMKNIPQDHSYDNRSSFTQGYYEIEGKVWPKHKWINPHLLYIRPQLTERHYVLDDFTMSHQYTHLNIDIDKSLKYAVRVMFYPVECDSSATRWKKEQTQFKKVYRFGVVRDRMLDDGSIFYRMVDAAVQDIEKIK